MFPSAGTGIPLDIISSLINHSLAKQMWYTAWEPWVCERVWETQNPVKLASVHTSSPGASSLLLQSFNKLQGEMVLTFHIHSGSTLSTHWSLSPSSASPSFSLSISWAANCVNWFPFFLLMPVALTFTQRFFCWGEKHDDHCKDLLSGVPPLGFSLAVSSSSLLPESSS